MRNGIIKDISIKPRYAYVTVLHCDNTPNIVNVINSTTLRC